MTLPKTCPICGGYAPHWPEEIPCEPRRVRPRVPSILDVEPPEPPEDYQPHGW
jgi:hypothetical protein